MNVHSSAKLGKLAIAACLLAAAFTGPVIPAFAQSSTAAVTGTVTDPSGVKVSGAKVALTNVVRITVSNGTGDCNLVSVPPARYKLTISVPGFQTENIAASDVSVAQPATSLLGTVIGGEEVNALPLNGRNFTQLLELTPGAAPISVGQNNRFSSRFGRLQNLPSGQASIDSLFFGGRNATKLG